ncbi:MAG: glycosyltransferase family 2 protein [Woeseia sp.]|jgi:glycosyltransferase involved in cell wall biosynthesis|nr:glycosyltransferase family 2 protein [Woeseia sp.]MBT6211724.1 glycosyltransferase family 2 protein [Woeseia sp.]
MTDLSIVVPLYNEDESVRPLYESITNAIDPMEREVEIIFVDDGSKDHTFNVAAKIASTDKRLRVVKFRRNYGQTPAMAAGIDLARGKVIVTMDGDLQNDPSDIPSFFEKMDEGYDIVVGWRHDRQDKLISRKIPSRIANWIIGKVTGVSIKDNGCSLKAYRAEVIKQVPLYSEMHRFIPAMASIAGPKIAEIKVKHHARQFGESKYGISRVYKVLLDLMTIKTISTFTARPLIWFAMLAIPFLLLSVTMLAVSVATIGIGASNALPMAGAGLLFGTLSIFLLLSGGIAEMISSTGHESITNYSLITAREFSERDRQLEQNPEND